MREGGEDSMRHCGGGAEEGGEGARGQSDEGWGRGLCLILSHQGTWRLPLVRQRDSGRPGRVHPG